MNAQKATPCTLLPPVEIFCMSLRLIVLITVFSILGGCGSSQSQNSKFSSEVVAAIENRNYQEAMVLLSPAIERGDIQARTLAGFLCVRTLPSGCQTSKAVNLLSSAAEAGNSYAQYSLSIALLKAVPPQTEKALVWLRKAAKAEHVLALFDLGKIESKSGKSVVAERGVSRIRRAAELNFAPAQLALAARYESDTDESGNLEQAVHWYRTAAKDGNTIAQTRLGSLYERGRGIEIDAKSADRWYRTAAEAGNSQAKYSLGLMYMLGEVVEPQYYEGIYWLEQAAESGYAKAQDALGRAYYQGVGVRKDIKEALRWFLLAGKQGHLAAQNNAGAIYEHDFYLRNYMLAAQWYERAAKAGYEQAMINIGGLYQLGFGVPENLSTAQAWYAKAAKSRNPKIAQRARDHVRMARLRSEDIGMTAFGVGERLPTPAQVFTAIIATGIVSAIIFPNTDGSRDPDLQDAYNEIDHRNKQSQQELEKWAMEGLQMNP